MWLRLVYIDKGFLYFVLILAPVILIFPATVFLFPDPDKTQNLKEYFSKNQDKIIFLFSLTLLINVLIGIFMHEAPLFAPVNVVRFFASVSGLAASVFKWKWLKNAVSYVFLVSIIAGTVILLMSGA
jgi:hypothetical membrane protein